ncbi:hypothetical protein V6Z77_009225 [Aspergillus fumigatus]
MRSYIAKIDERPSHFWTAGLSMNINWAGANILRHIYQGNRQNDNVAVISRAFYTTATYLFVQRICHAFSVKILTARVLRYCTGLITDHPDDEDLVRQNLKDDYKAGLIWNTYAEHLGGYGAFFLIGVVPPWMYEISLNQSDDLDFVVSHFRSIKLPEIAMRYDLHGVGRKIMSEITDRLETCLPSNQPRERRRRPEIKTPITSHSKITKSGGCALLQPKDATSRHGQSKDLQTESQHSHPTASGAEQILQDQGRAHPIPGMVSNRPNIHKETGFSQQHPRIAGVEQEELETCEPTTIERSSLPEAVPTRITAILNDDPNPETRAPPVFSGPAQTWDEPSPSGRPTKRRRTLPNYSTHHGTSHREHIRGQLNDAQVSDSIQVPDSCFIGREGAFLSDRPTHSEISPQSGSLIPSVPENNTNFPTSFSPCQPYLQQSPARYDSQTTCPQSLVTATDFFDETFSHTDPGTLNATVLATESLVLATDFFDNSFGLQDHENLSRGNNAQPLMTTTAPEILFAQSTSSRADPLSLVAATDFFDSSFGLQHLPDLNGDRNPYPLAVNFPGNSSG